MDDDKVFFGDEYDEDDVEEIGHEFKSYVYRKHMEYIAKEALKLLKNPSFSLEESKKTIKGIKPMFEMKDIRKELNKK